MAVDGIESHLIQLLQTTVERQTAMAVSIRHVEPFPIGSGLLGASVRRYRVTVRDPAGALTERCLVTKVASRKERRAVMHLNAQRQPNVPFGHTLDLGTDAPALLCLRDVGDICRPTSLEPITPDLLRREARGLAAIHAANFTGAAHLAWFPRADRAYFAANLTARSAWHCYTFAMTQGDDGLGGKGETRGGAFVPGRELARCFYRDVLAQIVGNTPHAAALLGEGSEVLGFDTVRSTDHAWGPRAQLFVDAQEVDRLATRLDAQLPETYRGWPVRFYRWQTKRVEHHIEVTTLDRWLARQFGMDPRRAMTTGSWLATPQQLLLEATSGLVFHDDAGALTAARALLAWYPDDVWRWLMAAQWDRLGDEASFVGRTAEVGDALGSRLVAARIVQRALHLCFLQERRYAPYGKWLGAAFARLDAANDAGPPLDEVLGAADFITREAGILRLYRTMARRHNALDVTPPLGTELAPFAVGINDAVRPFPVLDTGRFKKACLDAIADAALRGLPLVGSIDQLTNPTDLIIHFTDWPKQIGAIYQRQLDREADTPDET